MIVIQQLYLKIFFFQWLESFFLALIQGVSLFIWLRREIHGYHFLSFLFSCSQVVTKMSSNNTFFHSKRGIGWKKNHWVKYGNVLTQIIMFSIQKIDDLKAREQQWEEKGTTNSALRFKVLALWNHWRYLEHL